jgi:anti-anti-sigma factor
MDSTDPRPRRTVTVSVPESAGDEELTVPHALADRLRLVVHQGYDLILLDVSRLTHCNSMTLGAIVQTYVSAVKGGGSLKLLNVRRRFRDLLAVTKIDKVIEIVEMDENPAQDVVDPERTEVSRKSEV